MHPCFVAREPGGTDRMALRVTIEMEEYRERVGRDCYQRNSLETEQVIDKGKKIPSTLSRIDI